MAKSKKNGAERSVEDSGGATDLTDRRKQEIIRKLFQLKDKYGRKLDAPLLAKAWEIEEAKISAEPRKASQIRNWRQAHQDSKLPSAYQLGSMIQCARMLGFEFPAEDLKKIADILAKNGVDIQDTTQDVKAQFERALDDVNKSFAVHERFAYRVGVRMLQDEAIDWFSSSSDEVLIMHIAFFNRNDADNVEDLAMNVYDSVERNGPLTESKDFRVLLAGNRNLDQERHDYLKAKAKAIEKQLVGVRSAYTDIVDGRSDYRQYWAAINKSTDAARVWALLSHEIPTEETTSSVPDRFKNVLLPVNHKPIFKTLGIRFDALNDGRHWWWRGERLN